MKLSRPCSAREVNTSRFLCLLRERGESGISRAEISRILGLNKVSVGEIANSLITAHLVNERARDEVTNGRRPLDLVLNLSSAFVLAVDIGAVNISIALCDLSGAVVRIERFPVDRNCTAEEFCARILKSCMRTLSLTGETGVLGAGITVDGTISDDGRIICNVPRLPWKDIPVVELFEKQLKTGAVVSDRTASLVNAEKQVNPCVSIAPGLLYLNWNADMKLACVSYGHVFSVSGEFGKTLLKEGYIGDICSAAGIGLSGRSQPADFWDSVPPSVYSCLARALNYAYCATGCTSVIIGGEGSAMSEKGLAILRGTCPHLQVSCSVLGEHPYVRSAAELALDRFLFRRSFLEDMKDFV